jgi:glutamate synthase (NADPH) large chain
MNSRFHPMAGGLYDPANEHDGCGVGFVAHIKGKKSHAIVDQGLTILKNLNHRGAVGWDPKLSDGAGLLIQMPDRFLRDEMARQGIALPPAGQYGVGMVFLPREPASRLACEYEIERAIKDEGQVLLGWRDVPVDNADLAEPAKKLEPVIRQVFIGRGGGVMVTDALERKLYIIRKSSGHAIQALNLEHGKEFYVPSMSARTACCWPPRSGSTTSISRTSGSSRRSRSCTSASRPIPFRPGISRIRSG